MGVLLAACNQILNARCCTVLFKKHEVRFSTSEKVTDGGRDFGRQPIYALHLHFMYSSKDFQTGTVYMMTGKQMHVNYQLA